jgi:hypothetical protein
MKVKHLIEECKKRPTKRDCEKCPYGSECEYLRLYLCEANPCDLEKLLEKEV